MKKYARLQVGPERFRVIYQEVKEGSEPGLRFYILVSEDECGGKPASGLPVAEAWDESFRC